MLVVYFNRLQTVHSLDFFDNVFIYRVESIDSDYVARFSHSLGKRGAACHAVSVRNCKMDPGGRRI
ncbi:hypothetical protein SDC9_194265 [bioreactor metagenome]|uniref:Uncharacterized protein n=1 Tax=bioreactor metagenome TaxID=1076179 RepID=A0A645I8E5_9ZZZZ